MIDFLICLAIANVLAALFFAASDFVMLWLLDRKSERMAMEYHESKQGID